jgi:hypothetical protein
MVKSDTAKAAKIGRMASLLRPILETLYFAKVNARGVTKT